MNTSIREQINQYNHFKMALMRDFQSELQNNDYIETERHLLVLNAIQNISNEIRRLEIYENQ